MEPGYGEGRGWGRWPAGSQKLSEPLSEHPGLGPGGTAWVMVMRRVLHACTSACGAPGRESHPPGSPMETGAKSTEQGNAHPPIRPSTWADLWGEETAPAPARALSSRFPALPLWGSSEEGASLDVASPALLVRLNLSPSLCKAP